MKPVYTNTCKISEYKPIYSLNGKYFVCFWRSIIKESLSRTLQNGRFIESNGTVDTDRCTYKYFVFDAKPSAIQIKATFEEFINNNVVKKITEGFAYEGNRIHLSKENQMNYKAAYDLAVQTGGMNLPYKIKTANVSGPEYLIFNTIEEISNFYLKLNAHIQNCLEEGWKMKDSIDYSVYES